MPDVIVTDEALIEACEQLHRRSPELQQQRGRCDSKEEAKSPPLVREVTTMSDATDSRTWDLKLIEERWASVRDAIQRAASRIDLGGMRRSRHPVEYEWLAARGRLGPFDVPPTTSRSSDEKTRPSTKPRRKRT